MWGTREGGRDRIPSPQLLSAARTNPFVPGPSCHFKICQFAEACSERCDLGAGGGNSDNFIRRLVESQYTPGVWEAVGIHTPGGGCAPSPLSLGSTRNFRAWSINYLSLRLTKQFCSKQHCSSFSPSFCWVLFLLKTASAHHFIHHFTGFRF